jgi:hypothetical protein
MQQEFTPTCGMHSQWPTDSTESSSLTFYNWGLILPCEILLGKYIFSIACFEFVVRNLKFSQQHYIFKRWLTKILLINTYIHHYTDINMASFNGSLVFPSNRSQKLSFVWSSCRYFIFIKKLACLPKKIGDFIASWRSISFSRIMLLWFKPCHTSDCYSPALHPTDPSSTSIQSKRNSCWTEWQWNRFFC